MKITVTKEHIAAGKRANHERCPIALAVREAFPKAVNVSVGGGFIRVNSKLWFLPLSVFCFVRDFDHGIQVHPFKFHLR